MQAQRSTKTAIPVILEWDEEPPSLNAMRKLVGEMKREISGDRAPDALGWQAA